MTQKRFLTDNERQQLREALTRWCKGPDPIMSLSDCGRTSGVPTSYMSAYPNIVNRVRVPVESIDRIARTLGFSNHEPLLNGESPSAPPLPIIRPEPVAGSYRLSAEQTQRFGTILNDYINSGKVRSVRHLAEILHTNPPAIQRITSGATRITTSFHADLFARHIGLKDSAELFAQHQAKVDAANNRLDVPLTDYPSEADRCFVAINLLPQKEGAAIRAYALELRTSEGPVAFFTLKTQHPDMQAQLLKLADQITTRRAGPMVASMMLRTGLDQMRLNGFGVGM